VRRIWIVLLVFAAIMVPAAHADATQAPQAKAAPGGIGIRLVAVPTSPTSNPLARLYLIDRLAPGTSVSRQVEVSNSTRAIADVAVYAAGASLDRVGFTFAAGRVQDQLSSWTSVSRDVLRLGPGTDALETVTLRVPKDASPGEKYAVVWAQISAVSSAHRGLLLVNRVGIRMYVSIGLGGTPPPKFTIGSLVAKRSTTGEPFVAVTVHNSGEGPIDISGHLALSSGPGGINGGPYPMTLASALAPGRSELATAVLSKQLPDGPWKATISLVSGATDRSATATLKFPGVAGTPPDRSSP
jgi:hypothetical protein